METAEKTTAADGITWSDVLKEEKAKPYFQAILQFVKEQRTAGKSIYPPEPDVFNAFKLTPFDKVKVVIIGQDPYHGPNQAHGLAFSVQPGIIKPPSVRNIFRELHDDIGFKIPKDGYLEPWAKQGVMMLNTTLTVERGKPLSHAKIGWEQFTDRVIQILNDQKKGIIFLLWGAHAQRKGQSINPNQHHILTAAHPSPFSAERGFFGCRHFSKTNKLLRDMGKEEIDWQL